MNLWLLFVPIFPDTTQPLDESFEFTHQCRFGSTHRPDNLLCPLFRAPPNTSI
ncbi:uncharacterized protein LACBIDRAFT_314881 [Laccaria bicolor S238N-H82]|uniref:Predicted protein n=1 Tax=Laccaria bicolor (strain S238N-H82 / ATCC MYA-4686) TaxID=486041 RepID=B0DZE3_LACBS|nr:uncharacterized protein LACBIDRAFT_314881 [Laccaria bicolor S238N-H82]EDQ99999.1 predicted protein [Laccaria bicolor S238N-H82]|eukprot:XP_001889309.1 predicted protein [Laccaria bicolor S238N-H82]